jgi:hypothetical protein
VSVALASFDALTLTGSLSDVTDGLTQGELHSLDYLACLMAIYDGHDPGWWGLSFSVTETGAPFSRELSKAVDELVFARWLLRFDRVYRLSDEGRTELEFERSLAPNERRLRYLSAASSAALSMPLPTIADALAHEPGLRRALTYLRRQKLLDDISLDLVDQQFTALTEGLGQPPAEREDLMVPAVVWLTYLSRTHERESRAA